MVVPITARNLSADPGANETLSHYMWSMCVARAEGMQPFMHGDKMIKWGGGVGETTEISKKEIVFKSAKKGLLKTIILATNICREWLNV